MIFFRFIKKIGLSVSFMLLMIFIYKPSFGQQDTLIAQYKTKMMFSDNQYTLISAKEKGLALIKEVKINQEGKQHWQVIMLDTTLHKKWETHIKTDLWHSFVGYDYNDEGLFFLFKQLSDYENSFLLVRILFHNKTIRHFNINHNSHIKLTHFSVIQDRVLLGGYVSKRPIALLYSMLSEELTVISDFFTKGTKILDLHVNENNTFTFLVSHKNRFTKNQLAINIYSPQGRRLIKDRIQFSDRIIILSGLSSRFKRDDLMIVGTYTESATNLAEGIYAVYVDPFSKQRIQLHPFGSMNHFFDYLEEKKATQLKELYKTKLREEKKMRYKTRLNLIRIEETQNGFILLAEMYRKKTSKSINQSPFYRFNGQYNALSRYPTNLYNKTSTIRYVQSSVALFNERGALLWDISMPIDDEKEHTELSQMSDFVLYQDKVSLMHKKENKIRIIKTPLHTKLDVEKEKIAPDDALIIMSLKSQKNLDFDSKMKSWYNNYFYLWGYQNLFIQQKESTVFYINKYAVPGAMVYTD